MRRTTSRVLASVLGLSALATLAVTAPLAHADQAPSPYDQRLLVRSSATTRKPLPGPRGASSISPAGCQGKSNWAHKEMGGTIKGVTQVDCLYSVSSVRTTAQLWRNRWWGYEMVGIKGDNTNLNSNQVKASGLYNLCENNSWRTEGEHESLESDGDYYTHTMVYAEVTNC
jgi:hypothetical protein